MTATAAGMSAAEPEVMTPGEVAAYWRVDVRTVTHWAREGKLATAFRTPGGHRRFRRSDVVARFSTGSSQGRAS